MAKTVLLIDDDEDDLEIMKEAIRGVDSSILCITFNNPEQAIQAISTDLILIPDYVFIDINMAPFTGDKCLVELRKITNIKDTIIVMLSTTVAPAVSKRLIQSGANFTFEKPDKFENYRKMLNEVLSGSAGETVC